MRATSGSRAFRRMRQEMATKEESLFSSDALAATLLEKRRRKRAMFVSRKPTVEVDADLKGIEEFAAQSDLDLELSGVFVCLPTEPKRAVCAARFMSNGGRCTMLKEELQKFRRQEKLYITCHSP